jgi:hypothetical protein
LIKPINRYTKGADTFTVFTIGAEREIISRLVSCEKTKSVVLICDSLMTFKNQEIAELKAINDYHERQSALYDSSIVAKDKIISLCKKDLANCESEQSKLKHQRSLAIIGIVIVAIAGLFY